MEVLWETDTLIFGREKDQVRALGIVSVLACLSADYGNSRLFTFIENTRIPIAANQYGILYERQDKEAVAKVPVAFVTWAFLSPQAETIFSNFLRPLYPDEWRSGRALWYMDFCAPLGHAQDLQIAFGATIGKGYESFNRMHSANGRMRRGKLPNLAKRKEITK
jgi:hemolysin-activating ACP:hemolysin acyltransferase